MKKFFTIAILTLSFFPAISFAQLKVPTQAQCNAMVAIGSKTDYNACCTNVVKAPACYTLTTDNKCNMGILTGAQCFSCINLKTPQDYTDCCVNSPTPQASCNTLTVRQQCDFKLLSGSQCAFIIDSADLYKSSCLNNNPLRHPDLQKVCDDLAKDNDKMCKWKIKDTRECSAIFADKYSICQTDHPPIQGSQEWYDFQCDRILRFNNNNPPQTTQNGPIISVFNTAAPTQGTLEDTKVEMSCKNVNLSKVDIKNFWRFFLWIRCYLAKLTPLFFSIAFIVFLWNIINYIIKPNALKNNERRVYIIAGLIGLFVIVTLWGLVTFTANTLGIGAVVPQLPYDTTSQK